MTNDYQFLSYIISTLNTWFSDSFISLQSAAPEKSVEEVKAITDVVKDSPHKVLASVVCQLLLADSHYVHLCAGSLKFELDFLSHLFLHAVADSRHLLFF